MSQGAPAPAKRGRGRPRGSKNKTRGAPRGRGLPDRPSRAAVDDGNDILDERYNKDRVQSTSNNTHLVTEYEEISSSILMILLHLH